MKTREVKIDLPWPPSVNRIWKTTSKGGWYSTKEAINYKQVVGYMVGCAGMQGSFEKDIPLEFTMLAYPPDNLRRDLDNLNKISLDALQDAKVFVNDCQIKKINMEMLEPRKGGMITVTLKILTVCDKE
jgi:crossover junction endodeoxyribonuclease RusA